MSKVWVSLLLAAAPVSPAMAGDLPFAPPDPLNEKQWLRPRDLTAPTFRSFPHGSVHMVFQVSAEGRVTECTTRRSSGDPVLDNAICSLVIERARFRPGGDENGNAVPGGHSRTIVW